jgi:hypothetical protein
MSNPKLTNVLLSAITILLLILVVQNSSSRRSPHGSMDFPPEMMGGMPEDHDRDGGPAMPGREPGGEQTDRSFHPTSMVIGSLSCPGDPSRTLADTECGGREAERRRTFLEEEMAKDLPISKIYDLVVEKFGEKALTESALQIRKSRKAVGP